MKVVGRNSIRCVFGWGGGGLRMVQLWKVSASVGLGRGAFRAKLALDTGILHSAALGERAASNTSYNSLLHSFLATSIDTRTRSLYRLCDFLRGFPAC
jgi:hypothetical protein